MTFIFARAHINIYTFWMCSSLVIAHTYHISVHRTLLYTSLSIDFCLHVNCALARNTIKANIFTLLCIVSILVDIGTCLHSHARRKYDATCHTSQYRKSTIWCFSAKFTVWNCKPWNAFVGYIQSRSVHFTLTFTSNHDLPQKATSQVAKNETEQKQEEEK